jgi:hypothetical protein
VDNAERDIPFVTTPQTRTNLMPVPLVNDSPAVAGIAISTVGSGTEFGQPYIDVRFQGTATAAGTLVFRQSPATNYSPAIHAAVTPGLVYTASLGYRLIAGTAPTQQLTFRIIQRAANASGITSGTVYNLPAPTSALRRAVAMDVVWTGAVYAHAQFGYNVAIGDTVDVTFRLYANNLEQGVGNLRPLLQRDIPEVVAAFGDLDVETLANFVNGDNLITWSDDVSNAAWAASGIASRTTTTIVEDTAASTQHRLARSISLGLGTHTLSARVQRGVGTRQFRFVIAGAGLTARAYFDLGTGELGATEQCTASITALGGGEFLVSMTAIVTTAMTYSVFFSMTNGTTVGSETYTGDGTSSIQIRNSELQLGQLGAYNATTSTAITLATQHSGFVPIWYDQSGNGRNLTQATAANQPAIFEAGAVNSENGHASVRLDGVNSFMDVAAPIALGGINVVLNSLEGLQFTEFDGIFGGQTTANWTANGSGTSTIRAVNNTGTPIINGISSNEFAPLNNLKVVTTNNVVTAAEATGWRLGQDRTTTARRWNGRFSELVAFSDLLSTTDRQALERNQGTYYGISVA